jgi:hypothetical protein
MAERKIREELELRDKTAIEVFRELLARINEMLSDLEAFFVPGTAGAG